MIKLAVKHGAEEVAVELDGGATVAALKERLEAATGVFARHQKLIFKGRVLEDKAALAAAKVGDGAKLMLLVSQAAGQQPLRPGAAAAAAAAAKPPTARPSAAELLAARQAAAAVKASGGSGARSSGASSSGALGGGAPLAERRASWSKMGVVALRDLGLDAVPEECFDGLADVRGADLSQNRLPVIPSAISRLTSLASLRLADNALSDAGLPWAALAALSGLTLLSLDRNALTALPAALAGCSGLVKLSAAGNAIAAVEKGALAGLAALAELDLCDNALAALPESIGCCCSLIDLNACNNAIAAIPEGVTRLTRLQSLRLDNNKVKALPPGLFTGCASLAALLLRSNPITVEVLRSAPGFADYDARRRARTNKQLDGRVMHDLERAFAEGADVEQWQHYK